VIFALSAGGVADAWSDPMQLGYYAFNDAHAMMSLLLAGRLHEARSFWKGWNARGGEARTASVGAKRSAT
jgi:hypothetical protein